MTPSGIEARLIGVVGKSSELNYCNEVTKSLKLAKRMVMRGCYSSSQYFLDRAKVYANEAGVNISREVEEISSEIRG